MMHKMSSRMHERIDEYEKLIDAEKWIDFLDGKRPDGHSLWEAAADFAPAGALLLRKNDCSHSSGLDYDYGCCLTEVEFADKMEVVPEDPDDPHDINF